MKYSRLLIATAGACLVVLPAAAGPRSGGPSIFETFDANADGSLTQAEVDQVTSDRLATFDTSGDGHLRNNRHCRFAPAPSKVIPL